MAHTYEATATREGRWWIIRIPELDAVTQARTVHEIDTMAKGLVTALLDLDEDEADVAVAIELPASVTSAWQQADELQSRADSDSRKAGALRRGVVRELLDDEHLTQSDAGALLGLSYQRIQQLAKDR